MLPLWSHKPSRAQALDTGKSRPELSQTATAIASPRQTVACKPSSYATGPCDVATKKLEPRICSRNSMQRSTGQPALQYISPIRLIQTFILPHSKPFRGSPSFWVTLALHKAWVRISAPCSVTSTVCSHWALQSPFFERIVQPSSKASVISALPSFGSWKVQFGKANGNDGEKEADMFVHLVRFMLQRKKLIYSLLLKSYYTI